MKIFVMVVDSLRPDFLDVYNPPAALTPNIKKIAKTGIVFNHAFSQANWTYPSLYSLLSGLYPSRLNISFFNQKISAPDRILPELLSKKGYSTAVFSSFKTLVNPHTFGSHFSERHLVNATDAALLECKQWIGSTGSKKDLFVLYHLGDYTHVPYCVPDEFIPSNVREDNVTNKNLHVLTGKSSGSVNIKNIFRKINARLIRLKPEELEFLRERYMGGVRYIDRFIGRFYKSFCENDPEVTFILVADHGEGFLEHGIIGHGLGIYNELIKIPMIITGPKFVAQRVDHPVQLIDLYPTLCMLTGLDTSSLKMDGIDLFDRIRGEKANVICDAYPLIASVEENYKLISSHLKFKTKRNILKELKTVAAEKKWGRLAYRLQSFLKKDELYDYYLDPFEKNNIRRKKAEIYLKAKESLSEYISHSEDVSLPCEDVDLDDELASQLKGLGYM